MQTKIKDLVDALDSEFVNRDDEIEVIVHALLAKANVVMLGVPGTGKTALMERLAARFEGAKTFSTLIMRDSDTSAVFGPYSLKGLKEDKRVRADGNWLQYADIGFLDEVFKGNASVLNALLKVMNEHQFESDGHMVDIPLVSLLGASNEMPALEDGLAALWDRWHFRLMVKPLTEPADLIKMASTSWDRVPETVMSIGDLRAIHEQVADVNVSAEVVEALSDVIVDVRKNHGIEVSNRKYQEAIRFSRASAWMEGSDEVTVSDIGFVRHMFWDNPEQINEVSRVVFNVADPMIGDALDIRDAVVDLNERVAELLADETVEPAARTAECIEVLTKLKRSAKKLAEIEGNVGPRSKKAIAGVETAIETTNHRIMTEVYSLDENMVVPLLLQARDGTLVIK